MQFAELSDARYTHADALWASIRHPLLGTYSSSSSPSIACDGSVQTTKAHHAASFWCINALSLLTTGLGNGKSSAGAAPASGGATPLPSH